MVGMAWSRQAISKMYSVKKLLAEDFRAASSVSCYCLREKRTV